MKKNVFIVILVMIVLGLGGYLVYDKVINKEEVKKDNVDKKEEVVKEEKEKTSYNNLQTLSLTVYDSATFNKPKKLDLEIVDNKMQAKLNYETIDIKGLEGNVKSFIYNFAGCSIESYMYIIAINDANELFWADVNRYDDKDYLTFKKLSTQDKIIDVTTLDFDVGFSTCGQNRMAVILENGTIHPLEYDEKTRLKISDADVTNIKKSIFASYVVYKDNTIGIFDASGKYGSEFNKRLKYNNEELHASKFFIESHSSATTNKDNIYVVSNDKLYKLDSVGNENGPQITDVKVSLVNEKRIISSPVGNPYNIGNKFEEFVEYDDTKEVITFEDYSTFTIEKLFRVYDIY